jgi:hypothetical protein
LPPNFLDRIWTYGEVSRDNLNMALEFVNLKGAIYLIYGIYLDNNILLSILGEKKPWKRNRRGLQNNFMQNEFQ